MNSVCVLGLGAVGYPTALYISNCGFKTYGYDIDREKAVTIRAFDAFSDWKEVPKCQTYVVCVSSSWRDGKPDMSSVFDVCQKISETRGGTASKNLWYEGKSALRVGIGMAMGIPVVASSIGEQKYVVKHGVNGFLAKNEEGWYQYLKMLIENDDLRERMGKHGRETAEKELSLNVNGRKLCQILTRLT